MINSTRRPNNLSCPSVASSVHEEALAMVAKGLGALVRPDAVGVTRVEKLALSVPRYVAVDAGRCALCGHVVLRAGYILLLGEDHANSNRQQNQGDDAHQGEGA